MAYTKHAKLIEAWKRIIDHLDEGSENIPEEAKSVALFFADPDKLKLSPNGIWGPKIMKLSIDLQALSELLGDEWIEFLTSKQMKNV